jgi:hypothetical protein
MIRVVDCAMAILLQIRFAYHWPGAEGLPELCEVLGGAEEFCVSWHVLVNSFEKVAAAGLGNLSKVSTGLGRADSGDW